MHMIPMAGLLMGPSLDCEVADAARTPFASTLQLIGLMQAFQPARSPGHNADALWVTYMRTPCC